MNDISVGAVGAAIIAGLVSLLGLIIGKEQKVSEFRQAWIDELRKSLVSYLVNINAISDAIRIRKSGKEVDDQALIENYKSLNEASHSISLRVNSEETPSKSLMESMSDFEKIASDNSKLTPDNIKEIEESFIKSSKELLKFEWNRVKKGESVYVWTKRVVSLSIAAMIFLLAYIYKSDRNAKMERGSDIPHISFSQSFETHSGCADPMPTTQDRRQQSSKTCRRTH